MKRLKLLFLFFTIFFLSANIQAFAQTFCHDKVYLLDLTLSKGEITLNDAVLTMGCYPEKERDGYRYEIISDEKTLYSFNFGYPDIIFSDNSFEGMSGGIIRQESKRFALIVPFFTDGKKIAIYNDKNAQILNTNLVKDMTFSPGQKITITIEPDSNGVYREIYFYDSKNELRDMLPMPCDYICYNTQTIDYSIPEWEEDSYSFMIYGYDFGEWIEVKFNVETVSKTNEINIRLENGVAIYSK